MPSVIWEICLIVNMKMNKKYNNVKKETDKNGRLRLAESWMTLLNILTPKGLNGRWWSQQQSKQMVHITSTSIVTV